jgi:hypothetical protein
VCCSDLLNVEISYGALISWIMSNVLKWSINPISNPKCRRDSHSLCHCVGGIIWFRKGSSDGILWMRQWIFWSVKVVS